MADQLKTVFNPFTGKPDYINNISSTSLTVPVGSSLTILGITNSVLGTNSSGIVISSDITNMSAYIQNSPTLQEATAYIKVGEFQDGVYLGYITNAGVFYSSGSYLTGDATNFFWDASNLRLNAHRAQFSNGRNRTALILISTVSTSNPLLQMTGLNGANITFEQTNLSGTPKAGKYRMGTSSDSIVIEGRNVDDTDYSTLLRVFRDGDALSNNNSVEVLIASSGTLCFANYAGSRTECLRPNDSLTTSLTFTLPPDHGPGSLYDDGQGSWTWVDTRVTSGPVIINETSNAVGLTIISTMSRSNPWIQVKGLNAANMEFYQTAVSTPDFGGRYRIGSSSDSFTIEGRNQDNSDYESLLHIYRQGDPLSLNSAREVLLNSSTTLCFAKSNNANVSCLKASENLSSNTSWDLPTNSGPGFLYNQGVGTTTWVNFTTTTITNTFNSSVTIISPTTDQYSFYVSTAIGNAATTEGLFVSTNGWTGASLYVGVGTTVTVVTGTGAGTVGTPTANVNGANSFGILTVNTATTPSISAVVATVTPGLPAPNKYLCILEPANAATDLLSGVSGVYVTSSASTWVVNSNTTALVGSTQYIWFYHCGGI